MKKILLFSMALALICAPAMAKGDGYAFTSTDVASGSYFGAGGDNDIPAGVDYTVMWDIVGPADPLVASLGGWYTFRPWGADDEGAGGGGITFGAHATDFPGVNRVQGQAINANPFAGVDLGSPPTPIRLQIDRIGTTKTMSYGTPGGAMTVLDSATVAPTVDGDVGVYYELYCNGAAYGCAGAWEVDRIEVIIDGVSTVYEGASDAVPLVGTDWWNTTFVAYAAAPATVTIAQSGPNPFDIFDGTATWTVTFNEPVSATLVKTMFEPPLLTGDASTDGTGATLTTVTAGLEYTVAFTGVNGTSGTIGVEFTPGGVVDTIAGGPGLPVPDGSTGTAYSSVAPAPAAKGWVLIFLGVMLTLATAVTLRKKALNS